MALIGGSLLGAAVDGMLGDRPGWGLGLGAAVGALVWARRGTLGWVAPLPVLVVAVVTAGFGLVSGVNGNTLTTQAALWAVSAFPAMAAAEVAVLAAVAARVMARTRGGRGGRD
ncbi:hypothetical protein [Streptomyces sp. NPDC001635]